MGRVELIAFDIETTGFDVDEEVTAVGFRLPLGVRVFCQTGGREIPGVARTVEERARGEVVVSVHGSEGELLEAVAGFAEARLQGRDRGLAAFNGEVWRGGFDVPFLRSRYSRAGVAWPFAGVAYVDVMPIVQRRFNTTIRGEARGDLVGAYEVLVGDGHGELDPFEESAEAVAAFEGGDVAAVVLHNAADVLRTAALTDLAEQYCSKSDFNMKSLTPVIHDR